MEDLTARELEYINGINRNTAEIEFGAKVQEIIDAVNDSMTEGTPVNAANASLSLAVTGVVIDGETVSIDNPAVSGADVYEFCADAAQSLTAATNIAIDIESDTTKSSGTLTVDTQPTSGDTMTIGTKVYTFVPVGTATADGEVSIGADLAGAKLAIVAAINGTDGVNDAHPDVSASAFSSDDCTITALVGGTAGDAIVTTETFDAVTNIFAAAVLGSGADCTAAKAITALVAAVTASDTQGVGAADGAGDTIDWTADTAGVIGNAIIVAEDMANAAFAAAATLLAGGVNGTIGNVDDGMIDSSYIYRCIAANTTAGKNWRRISLGSAY